MKRTFKQEMELAEKYNIDVYNLKIAYEVNYFLIDSVWYAEEDLKDGTMDELFEKICSCVSDIWLKLDNSYSLSNIVETVIYLHFEFGTPINKISKYMVIDYIHDNLK